MMIRHVSPLFVAAVFCAISGTEDGLAENISSDTDPFRQLDEVLPTPDEKRLASGAPGPGYWQQRADYDIGVELDTEGQTVTGRETVTYTNSSPHTLDYLWFQLDQNRFKQGSGAHLSTSAPDFESMSYRDLKRRLSADVFDGGVEILSVTDGAGAPLPKTVVGTVMRIDLPQPLAPGGQVVVKIGWRFRIVDLKATWARGGYEFFKEDGNSIYTIAQWYPRVAAYTDYGSWQHKAYLGRGEFALEFGDYRVALTVPEDHVVAATGTLENPGEVLTAQQRERLEQATRSDKPVFLVTPEEAGEAEKEKAGGTKTWIFTAENVRDFAWASSRKFIWDAMGVPLGDKRVMAMSFYPKEAEPLWSLYSTHSIAHAVRVYSRQTFDYPYPTAISVNGPIFGMEYPMISFNGPRPKDDGTYSEETKHALISVIIHEVGHNYFPMIVNSDERQWTWMDEGLNSFVEFLAQQEWEDRYPSRRGRPKEITSYMKSQDQVPIMTNSESLLQFGNNSYGKPATALNILRETVLGRELFDFAFKTYANRWMFRRPTPADFFRTMEDASGTDLDWFWRGWFYTTKHVDVAVGDVYRYELDSRDPEAERPKEKKERDEDLARELTLARNKGLSKYADAVPELKDFYSKRDPLDITAKDRKDYEKLLEELKDEDKELLATKKYFYVVHFKNLGGLVTPVPISIEYADGSDEKLTLPAEIWTKNAKETSHLILTDKGISKIVLDPHFEIADVDEDNNYWPSRAIERRFKLEKRKWRKKLDEKNVMQIEREAAEEAEKEKEQETGEAVGE